MGDVRQREEEEEDETGASTSLETCEASSTRTAGVEQVVYTFDAIVDHRVALWFGLVWYRMERSDEH